MYKKNHNTLVLLSGGIDSCACIDFYLQKDNHVDALFIDYGQPSAKRELDAALRVCKHYQIDMSEIALSKKAASTRGFWLGRNAFFLTTGMMYFPHSHGVVALGIHSGTQYPDCSIEFTSIMQMTFDLYSDGRIQVGAPFLNFTKREIWEYCTNKNVPVNLTYSCELGREQPCGQCLSCKDLEVLYVS